MSGGKLGTGNAAAIDLAVGGRSSCTVDCLFLSSSDSSAISINRRLRRELVEEEEDPEAVCSEQAAERVVSRSSLVVVIEKVVSWGEKCSVMAPK